MKLVKTDSICWCDVWSWLIECFSSFSVQNNVHNTSMLIVVSKRVHRNHCLRHIKYCYCYLFVLCIMCNLNQTIFQCSQQLKFYFYIADDKEMYFNQENRNAAKWIWIWIPVFIKFGWTSHEHNSTHLFSVAFFTYIPSVQNEINISIAVKLFKK